MILLDHAFCDICRVHLGQLWNRPAAAPDLLPEPDFHVCDDCFEASSIELAGPYTRDEMTAIVMSEEHWS